MQPALHIAPDEDQQAIPKVLYQQMLSAHQATYGEAPSVKMRGYLRRQAEAMVRDLGMRRSLGAQAEDKVDTGEYMARPVEEAWEEERRRRGVGRLRHYASRRAADGNVVVLESGRSATYEKRPPPPA
ncbi:hypothetical protein [Nesterenkonia populi]|uniref:hypothetical protein n=1 Tax=Nesterenkonia populi TaxID=1591087 RepID=UPI0011BDCAAE|nr:hypothetical protein [Nesterenkonia populi]